MARKNSSNIKIDLRKKTAAQKRGLKTPLKRVESVSAKPLVNF